MQSPDIWTFYDIEGWKFSFIEMIDEIHPYSDLLHKLTNPHGSNICEDDVSILNSIISDNKGYECDFLELMGCKFREKFNYVRAFHASKPADIQIISNKGLSAFSVNDYILMAQSIFINDNYPSITIEKVRCAVQKTANEGPCRENKLHFFLTEIYKKSPCDNYHKFGSEYMRVVANILNVKDDYLKNSKGFPTIFSCNVPVGNISDKLLYSLLRIAICYLFNPSLENSTPLITKDVAISIDCGLSPSNIVSHHRLDSDSRHA